MTFPSTPAGRTDTGGLRVLDATGRALAYIYAREKKADADIAHVLTKNEARRIAVNVAKLRELLGQSLKQKKPRHKGQGPVSLNSPALRFNREKSQTGQSWGWPRKS